MKRLATCLFALALCGIVRGDDKENEATARKFIDLAGKIVEALKNIKDKASAENATPELEKLFADLVQSGQALSKLNKEELKTLDETFGPKLKEMQTSLTRELDRIRKDDAIMKVLHDVGPFKQSPAAKEQFARIKAQLIEQALQAYKLIKEQYPASLDDLTKGDKPFFKAEDLKDPWGKMYQYDVKGPKNKGVKPDVWTVDRSGKMIGNWAERLPPPKDKTTDKPEKDK